MFGQAPSTSPFGAPAPAAPFGAPAPAAFGGFGQPQPAAAAPGGFGAAPAAVGGFGTTSAFGQPATAATSLFGAPAATATTGAFGQPASTTPAFGSPPAAAAGGFGAAAPTSSVFGAPAPATGGLFGSAAPAPSLFGSAAAAPAFGAKPAGGGLFGSAPAPSVGLFGSAPAPASRGLFGAAPSPLPFGSPAPAPSLFGAPAPAPTAFGAPAPVFGAPTGAFGAAPAAGGFGQPQQLQQTQTGTAAVPYQTTTSKQDGNTSIILQAITAMPQYEQKSFEELRLEDYMAGNKGTKGQAAPATSTGFGGFGVAPAPAFGQTAAAPAFGATPATTGGLFGSSPAPAPSGGLFFGAPTPAPAFGQPAPAPAFGAAPAPATGGLFGSVPAPAPTGGLFGSAPAPAFGQPAPAPAFGASPAPATGGFFGSTPATAFGAAPQPAPAFGASPAPATGGLFGAPAPAPAVGGLFGSTPAPATGGLFGQPAPAPSLFQPAPATGGLFGAPSPAKPGGLFGAAPAPSSFGLFGQPPAPSTGGLFGQTPAPAPSTGGLFGSAPPVSAVPVAPPPSADALLAQQLAAVENQKKQIELLEAWRGNPPSGSKVVPTSQYYADSGTSWNGGGFSAGGGFTASSSPLHSYRATSRSTAKIRPRGYTPTKTTMLGMKSGSPILSPNKFVGSTTKTLFIKPSALTPKPKNRLLLPSDLLNGSPAPALENGTHENRTPTNGSAPKITNSASSHQTSLAANSPLSPAHDFYRQVVDSTINPSPSSMLQQGNQFVPKLSKPGYFVYPSISELESMSEADLAAVTGFKVERPQYGSVAWDGAVDVRGVDLDSVVVIESKNVSVYDEAELKGEKPQRGSKLNRPAVITMYDVYPKDGAESSAEAKDKMLRKIEKSTKKMGAELLSYDADNGVWTFRVGHFSRYGLDDDSDDDSDIDTYAPPTLETSDDEQESLCPVDKAKDLGGSSRMHAPIDEDECTSANTDNISYVETFDEGESEDGGFHDVTDIARAGEEAYAMMTEEVLAEYEDEDIVLESAVDEEKMLFPVEGEDGPSFPVAQPLRAAATKSSSGISKRLAAKYGLSTTTSNFDYGVRMRQSFRVAWRPDGSFIRVTKSSSGSQVLVQSRPAIAIPSSSLPLLESHKKHSVKAIGECENENEVPFYTLPRNISGSNALFHALEDFHRSSSMCLFNTATKKVVSNAFSLLVSLYFGGKTPDRPLNDACRLEAVSSWLRNFVASDMVHAITVAQSSGDNYGSIFAALSGGDSERASSLALMAGCPRLSLILSNPSVLAQPFCENQLGLWHDTGAQQFTPTGILRIFSLASGRIDIERQMYKTGSVSYDLDWRRRFGIYLWSCSHSQNQSTVSLVVNQYGSDVTDGLAPPAIPLYCDGVSNPTKQCILYKVLNHYEDVGVPLADIIDPLSHTPFENDFSASFHLCAAMSALSDSNLTRHQEDLIIDSLSSQLIGDGLWEWAVYVGLCSISSRGMSESSAAARMIRSKNIIKRFYSPSTDPLAESRRSFLQTIGIPPHWLAEAQAYRCASEGDIFGMLENLMRCSATDSMAVLERIIIPHMILEGEKSRTQLWQLLESLRSKITEDSIVDWDKPNGCGVFHQFLDLRVKVGSLSKTQLEPMQVSDVDIEHFLELATNLEAVVSDGSETRVNRTTHPFTKVGYGFRRTPPNIVNAEVGNMLTTLRMQLLAIKSGKPINYKSQMTLTCPEKLSFIRGLCGFEPLS